MNRRAHLATILHCGADRYGNEIPIDQNKINFVLVDRNFISITRTPAEIIFLFLLFTITK